MINRDYSIYFSGFYSRSDELKLPFVKNIQSQMKALQLARDGLQNAFDSGEDRVASKHLARLIPNCPT